MTPKQREIVWASAEHWLENWQDPLTADPMGDACPCCQEYYDEDYDPENLFNGCEGCPIAQYTRQSDCDLTPWREAHNLWNDYTGKTNNRRPSEKEIKRAFEAEYRFLIRLALGELE